MKQLKLTFKYSTAKIRYDLEHLLVDFRHLGTWQVSGTCGSPEPNK